MNEVSTQVGFDDTAERLVEGLATLSLQAPPMMLPAPAQGADPRQQQMHYSQQMQHQQQYYAGRAVAGAPSAAPPGLSAAGPSSFGILSMAFQNMRAASMIEQLERSVQHMQVRACVRV